VFGSWQRISTKGNGEELPSLFGNLASVMEYLLPMSGPDPDTVPTPGFFQ